MKKTFYWIIFALSLMISLLLLVLQTKSKISLLAISALIVLFGYTIQEILNKIFTKQVNQIYEIFTAKEFSVPKWIKRFRTYCISVALTCFMASLGVDLVVDIINGKDINQIKIDVLFQDLTLVFIFLGIIPQIFWVFNHALKLKNSN